jgi:hypothetical protein
MKTFYKLWGLLVALAALLMTLQDYYNANEVKPKKTEVYELD